MPRPRESERPQWQSQRGGPPPLRTSFESNSTHHRSITDRSPRLGNSPRGSQSDPAMTQKKLGTRISVLESQLGQALVELKNLKGQLANAEAAKKILEKKIKKPKARDPIKVEDKKDDKIENHHEFPDENHHETDVYEVPIEKLTVEDSITDISETMDEQIDETKPISEPIVSPPKPEKPSFDDLALKDTEINLLKGKLGEKEMEIEISRQENESLKKQLDEAVSENLKNETKLDETITKLAQLGEVLERSKANEAVLKKKLEGVGKAKEGLECEMKKMKVQTQQWRKAADAAAAVLACGLETNGSMDKQIKHMFDPSSVGGYNEYVDSPGSGEHFDDRFSGGRRKSSGIRKFGDLWKRKGHK